MSPFFLGGGGGGLILVAAAVMAVEYATTRLFYSSVLMPLGRGVLSLSRAVRIVGSPSLFASTRLVVVVVSSRFSLLRGGGSGVSLLAKPCALHNFFILLFVSPPPGA